jgi:lysophospholipase L1-like esterase
LTVFSLISDSAIYPVKPLFAPPKAASIPILNAVLLCAPPPVAGFGEGYENAFRELADAYEALSRDLGLLYTDATPWGIPTCSDGIHFTEQGHRLFALKMGQTIRAFLN